ncbi:hypothetical protein K1X12_00175 [Hyphomonas sp. WL0036]|uniref:hypothetical protein n=1 Tax=Hyphomonas sediminis TaxID=2866160 RepID=UPI001C812C27|nr:hypothetical protein [Hyphomonas sediminis]MBY9065290.1 hypothetical protein [Hyphomonas sediminis]
MAAVRAFAAVLAVAGLAGVSIAQSKDPVSEKAAVYMTYQSDADEVGGSPFKNSGDIDDALATLGSYNADQLTRGWISYSAMVASQDPDFRANVRDIEAFYGRDRVVNSFANGGGYARSLKGGDDAVGSAIAVTDEDLAKIYSSAAVVKEQGYSLQGYGWAKSRIRDGNKRADNLKLMQGKGQTADNLILAALAAPNGATPISDTNAASVTAAVATASDVATAVRLPAFLSTGFTGGKKKVKFGKEPVANQIASVAALRILGADGVDEAKLSRVMLEPSVQSCMKMQNLQLQGCVAGVGQEFEVPHCISQHALAEIADCLGAVYK